MRKIAVFLLILVSAACDKDEDPDKFSSLNGYWTVRTPDGSTTVTFRIALDSDNITVIDKASVVHNGTDFNSKPIDAGIVLLSDRAIESVTLVNNSFEVPYFVIRFLGLSSNENFTEMQIENSIFNINGQFREFQSIKATRN